MVLALLGNLYFQNIPGIINLIMIEFTIIYEL